MEKETKVFMIIFVILGVFILLQGCEGLGTAIVESVRDSSQEFDKEYGKGAVRTLPRGSEGIISINPYRVKINNLFEERKKSGSKEKKVHAVI